jgi:hypothetical protein
LAAHIDGGSVKLWRARRVAGLLAVVLLGAIILVRPGANRLRAQIVRTVTLALGRPVEVGWVRLRLFPQPGFDLENFVVHDDSAFSAEPILRAQDVNAVLRLPSLLRGHIEIARLNLTEPSLNLVRNNDGRWNVEELLERTAKTTVAPTGKSSSERRPGFPYIEFDSGRINLKLGAEKTPFALTDADVSLWQESENAWGVRLRATPMRVDMNLTDTGTLRVEGSWERAASLRETPVHFIVRWQGGQLGQATKLLYGVDEGWRGTLTTSLLLTGTPGDLGVGANGSVRDFRRYDVLGGGELDLAAECGGHFSSTDHTLSRLACKAPVGDGEFDLDGSLKAAEQFQYDLSYSADAPAQSLVALLRHARNGVPDDLTADGRLKLLLEMVRSADGGQARGGGRISELRLTSEAADLDLPLGDVPLAVIGAEAQTHQKRIVKTLATTRLDEAVLSFGPVAMTLGKTESSALRGTLSRKEYRVALKGDADIGRLLRMFGAIGIPSAKVRVEGKAKVDLQMAGTWSGERPRSSGEVQISSVRAQAPGLNQPVTIASADLRFTPDRIEVQNLRAFAAGSVLGGTISLPRHCEVADCPATFTLRADRIAIGQVNALLNPNAPRQRWYQFLSGDAKGNRYLLELHAVGTISAGQFAAGKLSATRMTADADLKNGKLRLANLQADLWDGRHVGEWTADFTAKPPVFSGTGTVQHVALNDLAQIMNDGWVTGLASGTYNITMGGVSAEELFSSAKAGLQVNAESGELPHLSLDGNDPLQVRKLTASVKFEDGSFKIEDGQLETAGEAYQFAGTASADRAWKLTLKRHGSSAFNVSGTLEKPHVEAASETEAALKP